MNSTDHERHHDADQTDPERHEQSDVDPSGESELDVDDLVARLVTERDEAIGAKQRAQADFANFQRRASESEQRAMVSGMTYVVRSLLPALDNLDRALETPAARTTVEQLRDGVRMVRSEIARALEGHGITPITPSPGDEFDPRRHEALMRQPAEGVAPDHVVMLLQVGYAMGDTILRPAKVSLAAATE